MTREGTEHFQGYSWDPASGTDPNTSLPPAGDPPHRVTERYFQSAADPTLDGVEWVLEKKADGTRVWVPIGGPGFALSVLGKYFVTPDFGIRGVRTVYHDLAVVVAAMLADQVIAPGYREALLFPGTYTLAGDLTLPSGIGLKAIGVGALNPEGSGLPGANLPVQIAGGNLLIDPTLAGVIALSGFALNGHGILNGGGGGGAGEGVLTMDSLAVSTTTSSALQFAWTKSGNVVNLVARNCVFSGGSGGPTGAVYLAATTNAIFTDCTLEHFTFAGLALELDNDASVILYRGEVHGALSTNTGGGAAIESHNTEVISTASGGTFRVGAGTDQAWIQPQLALFTAPMCSGSGSAQFPGLQQLEGSQPIQTLATTVVSTALYGGKDLVSVVGSIAGTLPEGVDVVTLDTGGAGVAYNLPNILTQRDGRRITIKSRNAAGNISVTPFTGQVINLLAANAPFVMVATAAGVAQTFYVDRALGVWLTI